MKLPTTTSLLVVPALVFHGIATAWQIPSFQIPLVSSRLGGSGDASPGIPQFILSTGHPWLSAHADELSQLSEPASFLCAPTNIPSPQHDLRGEDVQLARGLDIPGDLFHKLTLWSNCRDFLCDEWERAYNRLVEIKACPRAIEEARWLRVETHFSNSSPDDSGTESKHLRNKHLAAVFVKVLGSMKGLKEQEWMMQGSGSREVDAAVAKAFSDSGTELRGVERLTTSTKSPWLIGTCPSVSYLEASRDDGWQLCGPMPYKAWFEGARQLKGLKKLDVEAFSWIHGTLDPILKKNVDIEELWVGSTASFRFYAEDGKLLRELVEDFSALQNLKQLHLPRSLELQLGFQNGKHLCADYHVADERSDETRQAGEFQDAKATERGGEIVREAFPRLERLYIGDYCGNVTTDVEGNRIIAWDWTGRMEEWLADPEPKWAIPKRYLKDKVWKTFAQ
ncbi:hypothetical protein CSPAE12_06568 [Colletotrichum incanum]|nr:hypothetical protein CSPAE12_06568 [Colletotrichum incanum]